jgi:hypothetical protein
MQNRANACSILQIYVARIGFFSKARTFLQKPISWIAHNGFFIKARTSFAKSHILNSSHWILFKSKDFFAKAHILDCYPMDQVHPFTVHRE